MHGVVHGVEDGVVVSVEDKKYLYHLRPSIHQWRQPLFLSQKSTLFSHVLKTLAKGDVN